MRAIRVIPCQVRGIWTADEEGMLPVALKLTWRAAPENGWLEYGIRSFPIGMNGLFSGAMLVSGRVISWVREGWFGAIWSLLYGIFLEVATNISNSMLGFKLICFRSVTFFTDSILSAFFNTHHLGEKKSDGSLFPNLFPSALRSRKSSLISNYTPWN